MSVDQVDIKIQQVMDTVNAVAAEGRKEYVKALGNEQ